LHPGHVVRGHAAHLLLRQPQHLWIHHRGGGGGSGTAGEIEIGAGGWELVLLASAPLFFLSLFLFNAAQGLNLNLLANEKGSVIKKKKTDSNSVSV